MDCSNNNSNEPWGWQGDDCLQGESNFDITQCLWDGVTENEESFSYLFDDATPVKACGDLSYYNTTGGKVIKDPEEFRVTSSQVKRRRMLQFNSVNDQSCSSEISSAFIEAKEIGDRTQEAFTDALQLVPGLPVPSGSGNEGINQAEEWLAESYSSPDLQWNSNDVNLSGGSNAQLDIPDCHNIHSEYEAYMVQDQTLRTPQSAGFKGRKSYMRLRTPTKITSSVAYPFAFIKPCAVSGDVTLKDINQRIRTPPPRISKQSSEESCPISAFSGKLVVGKTKIRTEGGKGSITIMRTRG